MRQTKFLLPMSFKIQDNVMLNILYKNWYNRVNYLTLHGNESLKYNPRANRSGRKPGARITNSARLFTPGEKDSIADSKVVVIVGWVVISLISKKWMFITSGRGKNYKK